MLNVEFSNARRFRVFQCHFSTVSHFSSYIFSRHAQCGHGRTEYWSTHFTKHSKLTNSSCWQCLCTFLFLYFLSIVESIYGWTPKKLSQKVLLFYVLQQVMVSSRKKVFINRTPGRG